MTGAERGPDAPPSVPAAGKLGPRRRSRRSRSERAKTSGIGALAGALLGFFLAEFGVGEIIGGGYWALEFVFSGTLVGAMLGAFGLHWLFVALDAVVMLAFLILTNTSIMLDVATRWVRVDSIPDSVDAIVVLSAALNSSGDLNVDGVQRLLTGLELYQRGVAPRLFTTTVTQSSDDGIHTSSIDQQRLVRLGGAESAWTPLAGVFNTHDEAVQTANHLPPAARTVIVVTSPMHTRRACATFESVGLRVVCRPSREQSYVTWHPISPHDRIAAVRDYLYERLGMVKYRAKGWIGETAK